MGTTCPPGQGSYLPEEGSLNPFVGKASNGVWTLEVQDGGPYDVGTVELGYLDRVRGECLPAWRGVAGNGYGGCAYCYAYGYYGAGKFQRCRRG